MPERFSSSEIRFPWQSEDPFSDDVSLDLISAAADSDGPLGEELLLPVPAFGPSSIPKHSLRTFEREGKVREVLLCAGSS